MRKHYSRPHGSRLSSREPLLVAAFVLAALVTPYSARADITDVDPRLPPDIGSVARIAEHHSNLPYIALVTSRLKAQRDEYSRMLGADLGFGGHLGPRPGTEHVYQQFLQYDRLYKMHEDLVTRMIFACVRETDVDPPSPQYLERLRYAQAPHFCLVKPLLCDCGVRIDGGLDVAPFQPADLIAILGGPGIRSLAQYTFFRIYARSILPGAARVTLRTSEGFGFETAEELRAFLDVRFPGLRPPRFAQHHVVEAHRAGVEFPAESDPQYSQHCVWHSTSGSR